MSDADLLLRCLAQWQAGNCLDAERSAREFLNAVPKHPGALSLLALALHGRGAHEAALEVARQAITLSSLSADLYHNAGVILMALGRGEEALPYFHQAIILAPWLLPTPPLAEWRTKDAGSLELDIGFLVSVEYATAARPLPPRLSPSGS